MCFIEGVSPDYAKDLQEVEMNVIIGKFYVRFAIVIIHIKYRVMCGEKIQEL